MVARPATMAHSEWCTLAQLSPPQEVHVRLFLSIPTLYFMAQASTSNTTLAHLIVLRNTLDLNNTFNAAVFAVATMAFGANA